MLPRRPFVLFLALLLFTSLACLGGLSGKPSGEAAPAGQQAPQAQPQQSQPAQPAQPMGGGRPARSFQEAENAVVKFIATGTKTLLEAGGNTIQNLEWIGSGFIIDPSGIAVTNNHVVTGAATLKVYIAGDIQREFPARVIAASECMDLAVVQIEGGPFPTYLEWYTGSVTEGMEVYAAGFPGVADDYQYTLTKGIISRTRDVGETSWAYMEYTYLHDARIRGGNSGGPLITPQGQVVGINYAGENVKDTNFAIPAELARPVVERMRQGQPYLWLGIDGTAVRSEDGSFSGIWVASVESGSPADKVGLRSGDIILTIENLVVSTRGTMKEYCEILASRSMTSSMKIEVLRLATGELLVGTINGDPLKVVDTLGDGTAADTGGQQGGQPAQDGDFTLWTDGYEAIAVAAPASWTDVDGTPWELQEGVAASLMIAPDLQAFNNFQGPGIWVTASEDFARYVGHVQMLDFFKNNLYKDTCKYDGRRDYDDGFYRGKADFWTRCGPNRNIDAVVISVRPKTGSDLPDFLMTVIVHVTPNEDAITLLDAVVQTFDVVGALP